MTLRTRRLPTGLTARAYQAGDENQVLELINADRLPGQPACTPAMLGEAVAGRSTVDAGWWAELDPPRTEVLVDQAGRVAGVVSFAARPEDKAGLILWLHGREDPAMVAALVGHALAELGRRPVVYAFEFASALTLGLEGLPVRHRPATHRALVEAGFAGRDLWRYMRRDLAGIDSAQVEGQDPVATVTPCEDPVGWRLEVRDPQGALAGEATVGEPVDGIGVLWWIEVAPPHRGRGIGRALLRQALAHLAGHGAREVILYVDDDEPPGGERDRTAANALYDAMGFTEVDRLHSYTRRR
ncbi:hypothetical protein TH66_00585 [Carbonactinospora thermoautotrophica]|uniref:N-acetyltransferase domain-containing protein n=1 Tax=Carbonactinospora thermoautotrophica TaxID=1469144 RepID=A0A132N784_9ACTN|nr:GNAT family N-acetyltransferase [Carbonactinospora thermoautotrophica]KWX05866.1 hypothetical protein TH66_00585 [Carbonactinospora thermoautotrophica]KWX08233.1 hypothetical protein TR74_15855 [Carbonactinospora thermoautotrophica]